MPGVEAGTIKDKGDKLLDELCEETGGEAFFTGDMLELERAFTRIIGGAAFAIPDHVQARRIRTTTAASERSRSGSPIKEKAEKYKIRTKIKLSRDQGHLEVGVFEVMSN